MHTYVITGKGKIYISGGTFAFYDAENSRTRKIPAKSADAIIITAKASITGDVFKLAARQRTTIVYAPHGKIMSTVIPATLSGNGITHIRQVETFLNRRAEIARSIEKYGLAHAGARHTRLDIPNLDEIREKMARAETVTEMMGIEGEFYKAYYTALDEILPQKLQIGGRSYHPPITRGNAVVSYINALIYGHILPALAATGLDPAVSFIHEPKHGAISLALDVAEMYRPFLLSRTFLSAVGKYKLSPKEFEKNGIAWYLDRSGRQKVARAFSEQISRIVRVSGQRRKLASLIRRNAYALKRAILENKSPRYLEFEVI